MDNKEQINKLKSGIKEWNKWRAENPEISPNLRNINFASEFPNENEIYNLPNFEGGNFSNVDLHGASLRNGFYINCCFDGSRINFADLVDAYFQSCTFKNISMRVTKIDLQNLITVYLKILTYHIVQRKKHLSQAQNLLIQS